MSGLEGDRLGLTAQDMQFEEEISRNPYYLKIWLAYLQFKNSASPSNRYMVYERALKYLPRSYKLWYAYLTERMEVFWWRCSAHGSQCCIRKSHI